MKVGVEDTFLQELSVYLNENISVLDSTKTKYFTDRITSMIESHIKLHEKSKRHISAQKATKHRTQQAKEKIQNAINMLLLSNKKITINAISVESGVAFKTIKKYVPEDVLHKTN